MPGSNEIRVPATQLSRRWPAPVHRQQQRVLNWSKMHYGNCRDCALGSGRSPR